MNWSHLHIKQTIKDKTQSADTFIYTLMSGHYMKRKQHFVQFIYITCKASWRLHRHVTTNVENKLQLKYNKDGKHSSTFPCAAEGIIWSNVRKDVTLPTILGRCERDTISAADVWTRGLAVTRQALNLPLWNDSKSFAVKMISSVWRWSFRWHHHVFQFGWK